MYLLCARYYAKCFRFIISFDISVQQPQEAETIITSILYIRKPNLPKLTWLRRG